MPMALTWLRWLGPAIVPGLFLGLMMALSDRRRDPPWLVALVFLGGGLLKVATFFLEARAASWIGLDLDAGRSGEASLVFLVCVAAPLQEVSKVLAVWPAFRSKYFAQPLDGLVYGAASALGFSAVENALVLRAHPDGGIWLLRTAAALPAHLFFAGCWGYVLGRVRADKRVGASFSLALLGTFLAHALYIHLVYGRAPGALVGTVPLLAMMGLVTVIGFRDLRVRTERNRADAPSTASLLLDRVTTLYVVSAPPSLSDVREAMRREGQPIALRWIALAVPVTLGAMMLGVVGAVIVGRFAHIDFSSVDEYDVTTTAPVALLGAGLLAAFPVSGYLVARASGGATLLEPALGSALAILLSLVLLGVAAPIALVFGFAFSPIAWALACAGAWVGRPSR